MHFFSPADKKSAGKMSNHACPNIPFLLDLNKYFQFSPIVAQCKIIACLLRITTIYIQGASKLNDQTLQIFYK